MLFQSREEAIQNHQLSLPINLTFLCAQLKLEQTQFPTISFKAVYQLEPISSNTLSQLMDQCFQRLTLFTCSPISAVGRSSKFKFKLMLLLLLPVLNLKILTSGSLIVQAMLFPISHLILLLQQELLTQL